MHASSHSHAGDAPRADVLDALVSLVGVGLAGNRDADAIALLDAVRPWRAASVEVRFYDAWLAMRRDDFPQAVRDLQALVDEGAGAKTWLCRALLAATLFAIEEPSWRAHADAVIDDGSDDLATRLARQLRGVDVPRAPAFPEPSLGTVSPATHAPSARPSPSPSAVTAASSRTSGAYLRG